MLWLTFTDKYVQDVILDWPAEARQFVGQLRTNLARYPQDPRGTELLAALLASGSSFTDYWDEHTVTKSRASRKRFRHPDIGRMDLDCFRRAAHRVRPVPVLSTERVARSRHFSAACSVGK